MGRRGSLQQRRSDSGLCRKCGDPVDRPARKDGERAVYCTACLAENKAEAEQRMAAHRKANAEIAAQLRPFGYPIPGEE